MTRTPGPDYTVAVEAAARHAYSECASEFEYFSTASSTDMPDWSELDPRTRTQWLTTYTPIAHAIADALHDEADTRAFDTYLKDRLLTDVQSAAAAEFTPPGPEPHPEHIRNVGRELLDHGPDAILRYHLGPDVTAAIGDWLTHTAHILEHGDSGGIHARHAARIAELIRPANTNPRTPLHLPPVPMEPPC